MPKLMDWIIANFLDHRPSGFMDNIDGESNHQWMFARCSSEAEGYLPAISLPQEIIDECYLSGIDNQKIPIWWVEKKFIKGVMARLKGMKVKEIVPENTIGFERRIAARANTLGGVLVYVSTGDKYIQVTSPCQWILDQSIIGNKVKRIFNKKLTVDSLMIELPFRDPVFLGLFFRGFDRMCNQIAESIVELDKKDNDGRGKRI